MFTSWTAPCTSPMLTVCGYTVAGCHKQDIDEKWLPHLVESCRLERPRRLHVRQARDDNTKAPLRSISLRAEVLQHLLGLFRHQRSYPLLKRHFVVRTAGIWCRSLRYIGGSGLGGRWENKTFALSARWNSEGRGRGETAGILKARPSIFSSHARKAHSKARVGRSCAARDLSKSGTKKRGPPGRATNETEPNIALRAVSYRQDSPIIFYRALSFAR